jgi:hypothetical protein
VASTAWRAHRIRGGGGFGVFAVLAGDLNGAATYAAMGAYRGSDGGRHLAGVGVGGC